MTKKKFIAISFVESNGKLVYITTSVGLSISNDNGIDFNSAIDFLFNLISYRNNKTGVTFVTFAASRDYEFLFSSLPKELKDKIFQAQNIKKQIDELTFENESLNEIYFNGDKDTQEYQQADFDRYVNKLVLKELVTVEFNDYKIKYLGGKILTISKKNPKADRTCKSKDVSQYKSINIYDIYGFFKPLSLKESVKKWLNKDFIILDAGAGITNFTIKNIQAFGASYQAVIVSELAVKLNAELERFGINLTRYHGASAVTSWLLTKTKAKDYFHNYRERRQVSNELYKAQYQSFYGGRVEQFKIGTLKDVNIYDINSAYAFACLSLPCLLRKPFFVEKWQDVRFGLFFCEYDFSFNNPYFGLLPNRESNNFTKYKLKGSGYFWQPEIKFVMENYPECINIKHGFVFPSQDAAPFTEGIKVLYELRKLLQQENNPLEKVIKLALSSVYGKFCQYNGKSHYFNMFYAGFITSFTRAMLLEATKGYEKETICFQTDAIHTTANLPVSISNELGEYKQDRFSNVTYLNTGIYIAKRFDGTTKQKIQGFAAFNFEQVLKELKDKKSYNQAIDIFVGHNLHTNELSPFRKFNRYLQDYSLNKKTNPLESAMRLFEALDVDLTESFINSQIISSYSGRESALYKHSIYKDSDVGFDAVLAKKI